MSAQGERVASTVESSKHDDHSVAHVVVLILHDQTIDYLMRTVSFFCKKLENTTASNLHSSKPKSDLSVLQPRLAKLNWTRLNFVIIDKKNSSFDQRPSSPRSKMSCWLWTRNFFSKTKSIIHKNLSATFKELTNGLFSRTKNKLDRFIEDFFSK